MMPSASYCKAALCLWVSCIVQHAVDGFQLTARRTSRFGTARRFSTRRGVSSTFPGGGADFDRMNRTATSYLASISAALRYDEEEDSEELAIEQKRLRAERRRRGSTFQVTLPFPSEPLGLKLGQVVKNQALAFSDLVLDLDGLTFDRRQQDDSAQPLLKKVSPDFRGVVILEVAQDGKAWQAGMRPGDLIVGVSATLGDAVWPKSTLEGLQSAVLTRKLSGASDLTLELKRIEQVDNQFELQLTRPIGLLLQETPEGQVQVSGFTENAPNLVTYAVKVGDLITAVDSALGDKMWPVSTVEGVISACTARLPGQSVKMRFERPTENMNYADESVVAATTTTTTALDGKLAEKRASETLKAAATTATSTTVASALSQKKLLSRSRDVLRRYAKEDSELLLSATQQASKFKGKYALPAVVADKVVDALASASAKLDCVTLSMIMKAYLSCQQPQDAMRAFEAATGFSRDGSTNPPVDILKGFDGKAIVPSEAALNLYTATALIQAHAMNHDLAAVQRVLAAIEGQSGRLVDGIESAPWPWTGSYGTLQPDTRVYNTAIAAAEKIGGEAALQWALELFHESMESKGKPARDVVTYNTMISALSNAGRVEEALDLFELLKQDGIRPDKYTYTGLIKACNSDGDIEELLYDMRARGIKADVVTYNTMIKTLAEDRRWTEATKLITEMESSGVSPNSMTYSYLMSAMLKAGKPISCLALFESANGNARTFECTNNVYVYTTAITAASTIEDHERALELVTRMNVNGVKPNLKTLTAVMGACLSSGKYDLAAQLFKGIENPDGYAIMQGVRSLCGNGEIPGAANLVRQHSGQRKSALRGKETMRCYKIIFRAAIATGDMVTARGVIVDLLAKSFIPSKTMYSAIAEHSWGKSAKSLKDADVVATQREALFGLCLQIIDSLRLRNLPVEGSLYGATLRLGNLIGGAPRLISGLLVQSRASETQSLRILSSEDVFFSGWENMLKANVDAEEEFNLPLLPVRISTSDFRSVFRAEQAVGRPATKKKAAM